MVKTFEAAYESSSLRIIKLKKAQPMRMAEIAGDFADILNAQIWPFSTCLLAHEISATDNEKTAYVKTDLEIHNLILLFY